MIIDNSNNPFLINKFDKSSASSASRGSLVIKGREDGAGKEAAQASGDKVVISERSRLIAKATELSFLAPDVRSERVAELTAQIAAGTYKVSSEEVASSIIKKGLSEIV